jgi:hypothetical protein
VLRRGVQAAIGIVLILIVLWSVLVTRFRRAVPNVTQNFIAEIDKAAQPVTEQDRAWPLYRAALDKLNREPFVAERHDGFVESLRRGPSGDSWHEVVEWVAANDESLSLLHQAAKKEQLGFLFRDADWQAVGRSDSSTRGEPHVPLWGLSMPHLEDIGYLGQLLQADMERAINNAEADVIMQQLTAQIALAKHLHQTSPFTNSNLYANDQLRSVLQTIRLLLNEKPELLSDQELQFLMHRLRSLDEENFFTVRFGWLRWLIDDFLQRYYTDDGDGDGVLTPDGLSMLIDLDGTELGQAQAARPGSFVDSLLSTLPKGRFPDAGLHWTERLTFDVVGSGLTLVLAGRREVKTAAHRLVDQLQAEAAQPLWEREASQFANSLHSLADSSQDRVSFLPVLVMFGPMAPASLDGEVTRQERDATLAALALESFHRTSGRWPQTLAELTPDLLPTVPLDRFDGNPLRLRLKNGKPILYSVGRNRNDDGGQPVPSGESGWETDAGDWILWSEKEDAR